MTSKPSICFIGTGIYGYFDSKRADPGGGQGRQIHLLSNKLKDRGFDISFIVDDYGQPELTEINGMRFRKGAISKTGVMSLPHKTTKLLVAMSKEDADIFYIMGSPTFNIISSIYTNINGSSLVHVVSGDIRIDPELMEKYHNTVERLWDRLYIWSLQNSYKVVTLTERARKIAMNAYSIDSLVIPSMYKDVNVEDILPADERDSIIWVGRLQPIKQPMKFVELAQKVPNHQFVMIGGPEDSETARIIKSKEKNIDNFEYVGYVDPDEVHGYFKQAKALVNTSDAEGFPVTFLEAWRYGTPVASLNFSLDDTIKKIGIYGNNSVNTLSDKLSSLSEDDIKSLGNEGRRYFVKYCTVEQVVDEWEEVLTSIYE